MADVSETDTAALVAQDPFGAALALHCYCRDTYAGQWDPLYLVLSRLGRCYSPGPQFTNIDPDDGIAAEIFHRLVSEAQDPDALLAVIEKGICRYVESWGAKGGKGR